MNGTDLRHAMASLPVAVGNDFWTEKRMEIRERIITDGPEAFLTWPTIVMTMFVGNAPYIDTEYAALSPVGRAASIDPGVGQPVLYDGARSGNYIHQAHHIDTFEHATGARIASMSAISEFGGGYGALAVVARRYGFDGRYTIDDFQELQLLQRWYLGQVGVAADWREAPVSGDDLFIASFSLSEAPAELQSNILKNLRTPYVLLVCSRGAPDFIARVKATEGYTWSQIDSEPYTCYLIGMRNAEPRRRGRR